MRIDSIPRACAQALALVLIPALLLGQQPQQQVQQAAAKADFTSSATLVIETITVKDKNGKSIDGLTAKDFVITEDNVPQTISVFEYQTLPDAPATPIAENNPNIVINPLPRLP